MSSSSSSALEGALSGHTSPFTPTRTLKRTPPPSLQKPDASFQEKLAQDASPSLQSNSSSASGQQQHEMPNAARAATSPTPVTVPRPAANTAAAAMPQSRLRKPRVFAPKSVGPKTTVAQGRSRSAKRPYAAVESSQPVLSVTESTQRPHALFDSIMLELQDLMSFDEVQAVANTPSKAARTATSATPREAVSTPSRPTASKQSSGASMNLTPSATAFMKKATASRRSLHAPPTPLHAQKTTPREKVNATWQPHCFQTVRLFEASAEATPTASGITNGAAVKVGKAYDLTRDVGGRLRWAEAKDGLPVFRLPDGVDYQPAVSLGLRMAL